MALTISRLHPTGLLQTAVDFNEIGVPKSGSAKFSGSNALTVARNAAFTLGTNNHTIEFWMRQTSRGLYDCPFSYYAGATTQAANNYYLNVGSSQFYLILGAGGSWAMTLNLGTAPSLNDWHHYAIVRIGNTFYVYVDGILRGSNAGVTTSITAQGASGTALSVGYAVHSGGITGWITNFRYVNGTALYTGNFRPTGPLESTGAQTELLLLHSDSTSLLKDSSENNFTVVNSTGVTWDSLSAPISKMRFSLAGVYSGEFDEVNLDSGVAERRRADGTYQVSGYFDEYTLSRNIVTTGLQLYLDAGQPYSYSGTGTTWTDLSGNGRNGTLINGPTYSSADGGSIVFDGDSTSTGDYVQCSGSLTVTAATFVTWIKRNGNSTNLFEFDVPDGILFSRGTSDTGMNLRSNQLGYHWNNDSQTYDWASGLTVPDLTWCMVAVSVTNSSATAYLCQSSGITKATNTVSHASSLLDDIKIGWDDATLSRFFKGNIAIAQLYNIALSESQILQNFEADRGRFGI
jgi:hypothetical protein